MSLVRSFTDGLTNLVAGLGTSRDKQSASSYTVPILSDAELIAAYRTTALARRVVDLPAEDACREWREWQADAEQIEAIEAEEQRLGYQRNALAARRRARLLGGAAIYIGTGETNPSRPLDPELIRKGGIEYLTVIGRDELTAGDIERDPRLPSYGRPQSYTINSGSERVEVHPSRLAVFHGALVPTMATQQAAWGDSSLLAMLDSVKRVDAAAANVGALIFEAKVDVVKIDGFTENLRTGGAAYETAMLRRWGLAMMGKGINGALMIDAAEEYAQKSASFSGLPEVMDRFMQLASAASGIPMTLLFGISPGGMNATGESDIRGYYDRVRVEQTMHMGPAMSVLDECLIRSALGIRPPEVHYNWRPLWQPSAKERAEIGKIIADTFTGLNGLNAISSEAIGVAVVNALTEAGAAPGLEAAVDEFSFEEPDPIEQGALPNRVPEEGEE